MIDRLFGSKTRSRLLRLFAAHPGDQYFVRQLARQINEHVNAVRRELANLEYLKIIKSQSIGQKKFYQTDDNSQIFKVLKELLVAANTDQKKIFLQKFKSIKGLQQIIVSGVFENEPLAASDALIVGNLSEKSLKNIVVLLEQLAGASVRFTHFTSSEFLDRTRGSDRFLYNFYQLRHSLLVNNQR
jgi:DNA-binding transcriptional regulator YhcF (GntR family)